MNALSEALQGARRIVFFGGAGVSTESGIPDFRSVDGLYHQKFDYPPETIISHSFFLKNPEYFYRFYREKMLPLGFEPNVTHRVLARLEQEGHLAAVVTQNIDGLHQKAGSRCVYELHGSVHRNYCQHCGKFYDAQYMKSCHGVPRCTCGGIIKPDIVFFGEALPADVLEDAEEEAAQADLMLVLGSSLTVYPAAALPEVTVRCGGKLAVINASPTHLDDAAVWRGSDLVEAFTALQTL